MAGIKLKEAMQQLEVATQKRKVTDVINLREITNQRAIMR